MLPLLLCTQLQIDTLDRATLLQCHGLCVPVWCVDAFQYCLQHFAHPHSVVDAGEDDTSSGIQQHHERTMVQQLQAQYKGGTHLFEQRCK